MSFILRLSIRLFLLLFSLNVFAQCDKDKTVHVGIGATWPPYVMYQQDRAFGLEVDISRKVFQKAGYCVEFVRLPTTDRAIKELSIGLVDALPSSSFNQEREKIAAFSAPYRRERMRLFTHLPIEPIDNLEALFEQRMSFVINPGAFYGDEFDGHFQKPENKPLFAFVKSIKQRMSMVHLKRVEFLVEDEMAGLYYFSTYQGGNILLHPYVINDNPIHFMLNRERFTEQDIDKINGAIEKLEKDIGLIIERYSTSSSTLSLSQIK
ncbi:ABC-type amino acid transport protein [Pseudoalteromonas phenolica]|uniref:ABC-type amino acid transport protein n=1 Tax=Pseudoalteromonas phenolica TaxID=161398 RepID=A0A0S2K8B4_9GAMM|nr:ABC-type amino acid transport protein [Pseudoalteromonas phenolica]